MSHSRLITITHTGHERSRSMRHTAEAKPLPRHLCTEYIVWEALFTNDENEAHRKTTDTSQPIFY